MNIITSKSFPKDRYDYLAYQLGVDPQVVFDRNQHKKFKNCSVDDGSYFYFCGKIYSIEVTNTETSISFRQCYNTHFPADREKFKFELYSPVIPLSVQLKELVEHFAIENKLPYFVFDCYDYCIQPLNHFFPLSYFSSFSLSNEEIYTEVYNWILKCNEPKPVEVANDVKIQQAGFDLKTSFRGTNQCKKLSKKC